MNSSATRRFWDLYRDLPQYVQRQTRKAYGLWSENPVHPGLNFK